MLFQRNIFKKDNRIKPGVGIGPIKFGMNEEEIINFMGKPSYIEEDNPIIDDWSKRKILHYDKRKISFSLEEENDYKLGEITIKGSGFALFGIDLYGLTKAKADKVFLRETDEKLKESYWGMFSVSSSELYDHNSTGLAFTINSNTDIIERISYHYLSKTENKSENNTIRKPKLSPPKEEIRVNMKTFRSFEFTNKTKWSYPLMFVDVQIMNEQFEVYIYDIGFEPPYYDVHKPFQTMSTDDNDGLIIADKLLKEKGIHVKGWYEVDNILAFESNFMIRPDIQNNIRNIFYSDQDSFQLIDKKNIIKLLNIVKEFSGHSVELSMHFVDETGNPQTFKNILYLMYRDKSKYGLNGFVGKGSKDNISVLVELNRDLVCKFYNQLTQSFLGEGKIFKIIANFITDEQKISVSHNSFEKEKTEKFEIINVNT